MLLCSEIYYALLEAGEERLTLDIVQLGYARALATLSPVYEELLDDLGKRAVDILIFKAIIEKSGRGSYSFVEPMLKDYLVRTIESYRENQGD